MRSPEITMESCSAPADINTVQRLKRITAGSVAAHRSYPPQPVQPHRPRDARFKGHLSPIEAELPNGEYMLLEGRLTGLISAAWKMMYISMS